MHRLTGGNPFFVTEVLDSGDVAGVVPVSARDVVLARAARLSGDAREVLHVAALTGTRVEVRLLEAVTGHPAVAIDELLAGGLLVEDGAGVRFRHEIARLAVAQAVPAHRAQRVHQLVLSALCSFGCEDEARLAFHAEAAGDAEATLRYATAAAHRAVRLGCHRETAAQFERALRARRGVDPATAAALNEGLANELALLDRWQEAEHAAELALALWREAGDRLREGDALRRLARVRWVLCRGQEALAAVEAAVATLEPLGDSTELARAYAVLRLPADGSRRLRGRDRPGAARAGVGHPVSTPPTCCPTRSTRRAPARCRWVWSGPSPCASRWTSRWAATPGSGGARSHQTGRHPRLPAGVAEAERYFAEGLRYCEEHDLTTYALFMRGERSTHPRSNRSLGRGDGAERAAGRGGRAGPVQPAARADPARRVARPAWCSGSVGLLRRGRRLRRRVRRVAGAGPGPPGTGRGVLA